MGFLDSIIARLPAVEEPKGHLGFKSRLKWTLIILLIFLILGTAPLFTLHGIDESAIGRLELLEFIFGQSIGTLMTLGIGPIVTASIILQLLVGSGIIPWNLRSSEGKQKFQGTQKLLVIFFCVFEAYAYVQFGFIRPADPSFGTFALLIGQLAFGAFLVLLMDEVVSKWGIGSGVSLFIVAGVSRTIFIRALNPLTPLGSDVPAGLLPQFFVYISRGLTAQAALAILPIIATLLVFFIVVYIQAIKVEIPLAFGSIRGFSRRWPLNLIYTSNLPVILVAAFIANLRLMASFLARPVEDGGRCGILGCFSIDGVPTSGIVTFLNPPNETSITIFSLILLTVVFIAAFATFFYRIKEGTKLVLISAVVGFIAAILITNFAVGLPGFDSSVRALIYLLILAIGATIFSIFWVNTSGMDAKSVAGQIEGMGMQVPGFRRDPRIIESVLNRYIPVLTVLSGFFIGIIAAMADFTNALGTGTGILLAVMIMHNLYEQISMRYVEEMNPAMRKFFR